MFPGEAVFIEREATALEAGASGVQALVAYEARRPDMMMLRMVRGSRSRLARFASTPITPPSTMPQRRRPTVPEVRT